MPENKTDQKVADRGVPVITTPKEFEDLVREQGIENALIFVEKLRWRDNDKRETRPAGIDPAIMSDILAKYVRRFLGQIGLRHDLLERHTQIYAGRLRDLDLQEPLNIAENFGQIPEGFHCRPRRPAWPGHPQGLLSFIKPEMEKQ